MEFDSALKIAEEIAMRATWPSSAIPDLDLYMDQVTTLMEEHLGDNRRADGDRLLSKTMINNYTKDKLIDPPQKKKYSKEHIMLLVMIFHMKSVLTINDIETLFYPVKNEGKIKETYDAFEKLQLTHKAAFAEDTARRLAELDSVSDNNGLAEVLLAMSLIDEANMKKMMAEQIIDKMKRDSEKHTVK